MDHDSENEAVNPTVESHLPVKQAVLPTMDELNLLMERLLLNERQRARRQLALIVTGISLIFIVILAGGIWFGNGLLKQLQMERQLSEKSREDLLNLVLAKQVKETPAAEVDSFVSRKPVMPENASLKPEPEQPKKIESITAEVSPPSPALPPSGSRQSVDVKAGNDLTLRLTIPPPQRHKF